MKRAQPLSRAAEDRRGSSGAALFVAGDLPWPPDGGGRIATLRVLEAFAADFEVDLVAIADHVDDPDLGPLVTLCRSVEVVRIPFTFGQHPVRQMAVALAATFTSEPYRLRKFRNRRLEATVARLRAERRYEVIHHDQFGVAPLVSTILPATITHQNVESEIYRLGADEARDPIRRAWLTRERDKLVAAEGRLLTRFDEVFVLASDDASLLQSLGVERTTVLPMPAPQLLPRRAPPAAPTILSLGSMSWFGVAQGLYWFGTEVFPHVRARVPAATWHIVGAHPPREIRALASSAGIELHGHVHDLAGVIAGTRCAIVPLNVAGGIRMKLIDLMAWRVPAVATPLAARGLAFPDGCGAWREHDAAAFADRVVQMLVDDDAWRKTVDCGIDYLREHHQPIHLRDAVRAGVRRAIDHHAVARVPAP